MVVKKSTEEIQPKSLEIRLRNTLKRRGYILIKSRRKDPHALDYGLYTITDERRNVATHGSGYNGMLSIDEVEQFVLSTEK